MRSDQNAIYSRRNMNPIEKRTHSLETVHYLIGIELYFFGVKYGLGRSKYPQGMTTLRFPTI